MVASFLFARAKKRKLADGPSSEWEMPEHQIDLGWLNRKISAFTFKSLTSIKNFSNGPGRRVSQHIPLLGTPRREQAVQSGEMKTLETLMAGIAHEINNPAAFLHTSVHNLQRDTRKLKSFLVELAGEEVDNEILAAFDERFSGIFQQLDLLHEGTIRIQDMVKNLQSFSRVHNKEIKVDVQEGIETTLSLVRSSYKHQVDFITDFEPGLMVQGNGGELKQVYMNIMVNACQAIVEKQNRKGENTKGTLTIQTRKERRQAVIQFQDTGIGMSEEVRNKMFAPFFTSKPVGKGTGLGLSISYTIIKNHGGRIEVMSEPGRGTVITVYLPQVRETMES
jgi:signal transduction histidine kinase